MYSIQFITKTEKMDAQKTKAIQIISCITVLHIRRHKSKQAQ